MVLWYFFTKIFVIFLNVELLIDIENISFTFFGPGQKFLFETLHDNFSQYRSNGCANFRTVFLVTNFLKVMKTILLDHKANRGVL